MSLYPDVKNLIGQDDEGTVILDDKEIQKIFYNDRYQLMTQKKDELTSNMKRYLKSKSHYTLANNIQKIISLVATSSLTIATIVLTSGLAVPFFLIPTASGMTIFFLGISTSLEKIIRSKKNRLRHKIDDINTLIAKIEVYIEKAREDGIITPEEVRLFNTLVEEKVSKKKGKKKEEQDIQHLIEQIIRQELNKQVLDSSLLQSKSSFKNDK